MVGQIQVKHLTQGLAHSKPSINGSASCGQLQRVSTASYRNWAGFWKTATQQQFYTLPSKRSSPSFSWADTCKDPSSPPRVPDTSDSTEPVSTAFPCTYIRTCGTGFFPLWREVIQHLHDEMKWGECHGHCDIGSSHCGLGDDPCPGAAREFIRLLKTGHSLFLELSV